MGFVRWGENEALLLKHAALTPAASFIGGNGNHRPQLNRS